MRIKKAKARISLWMNRLLSRGGILVLIKLVLESLPVYWTSIMAIPRGVMDKIRRLSFKYLWSKGVHLVKWAAIAAPKEMGGWGLKNLHLFSRALAGKILWHLTQRNSLWEHVTCSKYMSYLSIVNWFKYPAKFSKGSLVWKVLVENFPLVGDFVVWKIGDERQVRLREDPWLGAGNLFRLSKPLLLHLREA
jgi:mannosylglycoprotein endo-beta-mannosidase